ncbi:hypothetical protein ABW21_db0201237 [Orbilia brochopaga]|nr:hypothetical protein ABW21_db0201237 [Drechslerella brochopaga]
MSFRKRSIALNTDAAATNPTAAVTTASNPTTAPLKGTRPSFLTGVPTTSTGTASLDALLSGHAGLPLGSVLLVEESSTTDFAGALLRYFAAEGIVQGHRVVVVGVSEGWGRELPGLSERREDGGDGGKGKAGERERMKIAWRYEVMGNRRAPPANAESPDPSSSRTPTDVFCHTYDLTKRLAIPPSSKPPIYIPPQPPQLLSINPHPFHPLLARLTVLLSSYDNDSQDDGNMVTRIVIPNLLSPLLYPPAAALPANILAFLHALRALTRRYSARVAVMMSLSVGVHPRSTGLVRQIEGLADGVIELHPVPAFAERAEMQRGASNSSNSSSASGSDEVPQGLVRVWKAVEGKRGTGITVGGEGGGGSAGMEGGDDLAFMLTRRRMRIERFSLPVDDGDEGGEEKATKVDLEF